LFIAVIVNNLQTARKLINDRRAKKTTMRRIGEIDSVDSFEQLLRRTNAKDLEREAEELRRREAELENELLKEGGIVEELLGIENYYPAGLPERTKELLSDYFLQMASLEYNLHAYDKIQKVLDELVDIGKDK
ncbi:hypothetical protein HK100_009595, partial [Physocladia obscura]